MSERARQSDLSPSQLGQQSALHRFARSVFHARLCRHRVFIVVKIVSRFAHATFLSSSSTFAVGFSRKRKISPGLS